MIKNTKKQNFSALLILCTALAACDTDFDNPVDTSGSTASRGDADFSTFVAIGDSLTAGYADNALYQHGQENSFPAILAQQFSLAGGGNFNQPLMNDNLGGLLLGGNILPDSNPDSDNRFPNRLVLDQSDPENPELTPIEGTPANELSNAPLTGLFNNMGVPAAKSFHLLLSGLGNLAGIAGGTANPYFVRFSSSSVASVMDDALIMPPSFITLWIGNNDVLLYATRGGHDHDTDSSAVDRNTVALVDAADPLSLANQAGAKFADITHNSVFDAAYQSIVGLVLRSNPAVKGVLINIPDIQSVPYFTRVPSKPIPAERVPQALADLANNVYTSYNSGLEGALAIGLIDQAEFDLRVVEFTANEANAVVIEDESLTTITFPPATSLPLELTALADVTLPNYRQSNADDLILLPASTRIGELADPSNPNSIWGVGVPMKDYDVLIPDEINAINNARAAYNSSIQAMVDSNPDNFILFDADAMLAELKANGIDYGTGKITDEFVRGGGFSLDGVHPTARGYAVIANRIIDTINLGFNASIPRTDPGAFTTIFIK